MAIPASAEGVKICIDPGHGGENLGAEWEDYTEKEITLIVANSMKEELEKYEGIEVFMTRTSDVDMELKERIDYAKSVGADFFFCLHFNMSVNHDIYGTENWISAFGKNYARGMDFAKIEMDMLTDLGLYDRGIKTRLNKKGKNYYGVLRMGDEAGIPGVIIEHCHLDNYNDAPFYDHNELLVKYGKLDATAVAKYYGLYSPELSQDFRDYTFEPTPIPSKKVSPDTTEPEVCQVKVGDIYEEEQVDETGQLVDYKSYVDLEITASDPDSRMLYYSFSFDGGNTFSERYPWQGDYVDKEDTISATVELPYGRDINLVVNAYNLFDLCTSSDSQYLGRLDKKDIPEPVEEIFEDEITPEYETISPYDTVDIDASEDIDLKTMDKTLIILIIVLAVAGLIVFLVGAYFIIEISRHNRRKRKRNKYKRN